MPLCPPRSSGASNADENAAGSLAFAAGDMLVPGIGMKRRPIAGAAAFETLGLTRAGPAPGHVTLNWRVVVERDESRHPLSRLVVDLALIEALHERFGHVPQMPRARPFLPLSH